MLVPIRRALARYGRFGSDVTDVEDERQVEVETGRVIIWADEARLVGEGMGAPEGHDEGLTVLVVVGTLASL